MLALSLLKKEYELSKLQQKIGKEVCAVLCIIWYYFDAHLENMEKWGNLEVVC